MENPGPGDYLTLSNSINLKGNNILPKSKLDLYA